MPFDKGAMRFAFYVVDEENPDRKYVGKVYQFDDPVFNRGPLMKGTWGRKQWPPTWLKSSVCDTLRVRLNLVAFGCIW
jgi:hypothetical protein